MRSIISGIMWTALLCAIVFAFRGEWTNAGLAALACFASGTIGGLIYKR